MNEQQSVRSWLIGLVIICTLSGGILGLILFAIMGSQDGLQIPFFPKTKEQETKQQIVNLLKEEDATIHVVERVSPSVVSIVVKKMRGDVLVENVMSIPNIDQSEWIDVSGGTGFFVTSDGYVLTNRHVVDFEKVKFFIVTNDGKELDAKLIDIDPFLDIAILDVDGSDFPVAVLGDSDAIRIGQTVIAIGNTLSEFRNTVTKGVVSGMNRRVTAGVSLSSSEVIDKAIQTDAAINPGNSGGPLINLYSEVIGINTAISIGGESVAFSIPINEAKKAIQDVMTTGRIVRPWLGVHYVLVDVKKEQPDISSVYKMGAMIVRGRSIKDVAVFKDGPAEKAGMKEGDIIVAVNNNPISEEHGLSEQIFSLKPGDHIQLTYIRNKVIDNMEAILSEYENQK